MKCPKCQGENPEGKKYCGDCGHRLDQSPLTSTPIPSTDSERKHVTVLFSDMSGYTAMTEKLDPEDVKEIMGRVFGEISRVVARYEGFIEKFIGDAVMALFGAVTAHEDDPVRAIKAAKEIHDIVSFISPTYEKRIGRPLAMHTGICTGLVVTGDVNLEKGTHGVLGDTINTAARLSGLAKPGEIVISSETYQQAEGYFTFEQMEATTVKGKAAPVKPYRVLSSREDPTKTHRISGLRAELIGRKVEMAQLQEALQNLKQGKGSIFSIVGDAGTGKSRLIEEFKATINPEEIQWREGHAYAYSQNIPYFPVMDLLSRAWQVHEGDSIEKIREKVETGARARLEGREDLIPYIGSLYSLKYPEIDNAGPEVWKVRLHEAIQMIIADLCKQTPAVICIEDLHWADPSSIELLRSVLSHFRRPALFLCIYRPVFSLFTSHQARDIKSYQEIKLQDLSATDAQNMVESLLKTEDIPSDLQKFIQTRVEGNPFYLEEAVNSLIESGTLIRDSGNWKLTRQISEAIIPSTVHGIITARLDRLERETKRILQEASVIGRAFLYEILKRVTDLKDAVDKSLNGLERLDFIRARTLQPDLEYIFKHALTQEVVYNGLLKKERQAVHERIGFVMEQLFHDRLPEFYETLAYHYKQGQSHLKAVDYLMKAGEKSLNRYAVEESHQYYKDAHDLLSSKSEKSREEKKLLIDLLIDWAFVYHRRASHAESADILRKYESIAVSLDDQERLGMFYARLGHATEYSQKDLWDAYRYLRRALEIGEEIQDQRIIATALGGLTYACSDLGLLDDAVKYGEKCYYLDLYKSDKMLFVWLSTGIAMTHFIRGEVKKIRDTANSMIDFGLERSYVPSLGMGLLMLGQSFMAEGSYSLAIEQLKKARQTVIEPLHIFNASVLLGWNYIANGQYKEAEDILQEVTKMSKTRGYAYAGKVAQGLYGIILITKGNLQKGIELIEGLIKEYYESENKFRFMTFNLMLGRVYLQMLQGGSKKDLSFFVKNARFLIKTIPFAHKKAEKHFIMTIDTAKDTGAKCVLAQAYFDMGRLHQAKRRHEEARKYINEAIRYFKECEAEIFLKQAREVLATLG